MSSANLQVLFASLSRQNEGGKLLERFIYEQATQLSVYVYIDRLLLEFIDTGVFPHPEFSVHFDELTEV